MCIFYVKCGVSQLHFLSKLIDRAYKCRIFAQKGYIFITQLPLKGLMFVPMNKHGYLNITEVTSRLAF